MKNPGVIAQTDRKKMSFPGTPYFCINPSFNPNLVNTIAGIRHSRYRIVMAIIGGY